MTNNNKPIKPDGKKRQSTPKTRTGCITCKVRRVKCDEAKPECNRCLKTGRKCDGYAINTTPNGTQAITVYNLPTRVPGNSQEKRAFQYFILQTAGELSGFYSSSFWESLILQASASDPALRHAVIALGTIHEEFRGKRLSYYTKTEGTSEGMSFGVNQYAKAIGHLRKSLATGKQSPVSALMTCIIFVCFDSLRGYFESAMLHLQSGLKILGELTALSREEVNFIEKELVPLFLRLSVQAILYFDTRSSSLRREFVAKLASISTKETKTMVSFETLEEARQSMNRAADGLFRWFYVADPELPMGCQTDGTYTQFLAQSEQLSSWHSAFVKFMATNSNSMNGRQVRGAALLKIQHSVAKMMAATIPKPGDPRKLGEAANDPDFFKWMNNDFQAIINMSRSLIAAAEQDAQNGQHPLTFSTDLGIIGPLYYVCVRCQDKQLKQSALDLLDRCQRKEGMWDSEAAVRMIREFWEIEEKHRQSQIAFADEPGMRIPITEVVELQLSDGMKWDWKWKIPFSGAPSPSYALDPDFTVGNDYDMFPPDFWLYGSTTESDSRFSEISSTYSGEEE